MSVEPRSRMISFRITDDEYERFHELCLARGLRSVSEMVRVAINHMLEEPVDSQNPHSTELPARVTIIESRLRELASAVARIEKRLATGDFAAHDPRLFV